LLAWSEADIAALAPTAPAAPRPAPLRSNPCPAPPLPVPIEVSLSTFLSGSKIFASNSSRFLFLRIRKINNPTKAIRATPPNAPPTIAPVLVDLFDGVEVFEVLGMTIRVVVTRFVVSRAVETVDGTLLVKLERDVLDVAAAVVVVAIAAAVEEVEATLVKELVDATDWVDTDEIDDVAVTEDGTTVGLARVTSVPVSVPIDAKPKPRL
jgi:hypothetical protein